MIVKRYPVPALLQMRLVSWQGLNGTTRESQRTFNAVFIQITLHNRKFFLMITV